MAYAAFWAIWLTLGIVGAKAWLSNACPHAGCSGILVGLQLPGLLLWFAAWLGLGVAVSVLLSRSRETGAQGTVLVRPPAATSEDDDRLDEPSLMAKYEITREGERYAFRSYKYDRLADAVNYARLIRGRGDT
jgi:hypothetical protein